MNHDCLVAFGSNEGESSSIFQEVVERLKQSHEIEELRCSEPLITAPVGGPKQQRDYLNACFRLRTKLEPAELFGLLMVMEADLGRERRQRWGSRKIDLDLLLHGGSRYLDEQSNLEVPHPRMTFRRFVLEPAVEIAADMMHCVAGMSLSELLEHIETTEDRIRLFSDQERSSIETLQTICRDLGWEFSASSLSPVPSKFEAAKLNVYFPDESETAERQMAGKGPLLKLATDDSKHWGLEIAAAVSALNKC